MPSLVMVASVVPASRNSAILGWSGICSWAYFPISFSVSLCFSTEATRTELLRPRVKYTCCPNQWLRLSGSCICIVFGIPKESCFYGRNFLRRGITFLMHQALK